MTPRGAGGDSGCESLNLLARAVGLAYADSLEFLETRLAQSVEHPRAVDRFGGRAVGLRFRSQWRCSSSLSTGSSQAHGVVPTDSEDHCVEWVVLGVRQGALEGLGQSCVAEQNGRDPRRFQPPRRLRVQVRHIPGTRHDPRLRALERKVRRTRGSVQAPAGVPDASRRLAAAERPTFSCGSGST